MNHRLHDSINFYIYQFGLVVVIGGRIVDVVGWLLLAHLINRKDVVFHGSGRRSS